MYQLCALYLKGCFCYAQSLRVVSDGLVLLCIDELVASDGMCCFNLGGLQADLKGGLGGASPFPVREKSYVWFCLLPEAELRPSSASPYASVRLNLLLFLLQPPAGE